MEMMICRSDMDIYICPICKQDVCICEPLFKDFEPESESDFEKRKKYNQKVDAVIESKKNINEAIDKILNKNGNKTS
jgi:hypothetical protein